MLAEVMHGVSCEVREAVDSPGPDLHAAWRLHWLAMGRSASSRWDASAVRRAIASDPDSAGPLVGERGGLRTQVDPRQCAEQFPKWMLQNIMEEAAVDAKCADSEAALRSLQARATRGTRSNGGAFTAQLCWRPTGLHFLTSMRRP